ncbi:MAG: 1-deoxy-D-xylulose-5-phosphate synthase [Ruminococcaceae bacterium]|nr:1-deoxy-D-xylulose-5-phosphate synthase [Oscillospiraceae bacterium]
MDNKLDDNKKIEYLSKISSPADLKDLSKEKIDTLAKEIRSELVRVVSKNGGHLASNLGVVELTIAIHRVFDSPKDHIIFDVGHQSYVHKMLTGRYDRIDTIRQNGGLCGFPKINESEYDCFGAGHSSTSLSAALGFAAADHLSGSDAYTVAVVGDGAYTGGMIHEALNNCRKDMRLIIILNENEMSISKNIGRFATNLSKLRTSSGYFRTKRATGSFLKKIPLVGRALFNCVKHIKMMFKNSLYGSNYFESMGLTYLGPIDGNDYGAVENLLIQAKKYNESVIVHVKTQKGKGYEPAENAPALYHSMIPNGRSAEESTFSTVMGHRLTEMGEKDERICAITAAMEDGTGLNEWHVTHPDRFFDVGIAEEHAVTFAAGLAANGMRPVVAVYSTFLQRGYDNVIHDVALQKLPVTFMIDRAGLNAKDGPTHHGIFDVAFLSHIPNIRIYTPISYRGLIASMNEAIGSGVPAAVRYPSGKEDETSVSRFYKNGGYDDIGVKTDFSADDIIDVMIVTHGRIVREAISAADRLREEGIRVGIILLEMLKPYDLTAKRIEKFLTSDIKAVIFLEEEIRSGGMGMNLTDKMSIILDENNIRHKIIAIDDSFVENTEAGESILKTAGIDSESIMSVIKEIINGSRS